MYNNEEIRNFCWDTYYNITVTYAISIIIGFVVVLVNWILKLIINRLAKF